MFKEILVPIDMEETELTGRAIAVAEDLGERYGATITVVTAIPDFSSSPLVASYFPDDAAEKAHEEMHAELEKLIGARFKKPDGIKCAVMEGSPRKTILKYVEEHGIDLVVMPARKTDISKLILGSNSAHVVQHAPCSVLIVRK